MEKVRNLVVISGKNDNAPLFTTRIEPVRLEEDVEMAVRSIFYCNIRNVTEMNNKIKVEFEHMTIEFNPARSRLVKERHSVQIPTGTYTTVFGILSQIEKQVNKLTSEHKVNL